jgi:AcrR family transcriptional regulator
MPKRKYHHGDLRRALIDGAVELVREQGLQGWTLRGVARRVGVSHAAPYHHFSDVEALLGAVTALGFDQLRREMLAALEPVEDLRERLLTVGRSYAQFGAANPGLYQVMFREVRSDAQGSDEGREAGLLALGVFLQEIAAGQEAGLVRGGSPMELMLPAWSLLHGFITLAVLGPLPGMGLLTAPYEELVEQASQAATGTLLL